MLQSELSKELEQSNTKKLGMSDATTVPVKRRLVWGEVDNEEQLENQSQTLQEEKEIKQDSEEAQELEESAKDFTKDDEPK